jgi:hypothetical protein
VTGSLIGCEIYQCQENGIGTNRDRGLVVDGCEVHHCGSDAFQGHNSGGMKFTASGDRGLGAGAVVRRTKSYSNKGNGIWYDVDAGNCLNDGWPPGEKDMGEDAGMGDDFDGNFYGWDGAVVIEDCEVWDNDARGIFWEVSRGPIIIRRNKAHHNNTDRMGNAAGIGVSAAKNALIEDNEVWDNNGNKDIWVGQIERPGDRPWEPGWYKVRDVIVRRNAVTDLNRIADNVDAGVSYDGNYRR